MGKIEDDLMTSDTIASSQIVKPTKQEKNVLSSYCTLSLKCKKIEEKVQNEIKEKKPLIKDIKSFLMEELKTKNAEILLIPVELRKEVDLKFTSMGLPTVPPYIRNVSFVKDITVNSETVAEAISSLDIDEVEKGMNPREAIINCILHNIKRSIRSFSEQIKLTESVPRHLKAADIEIASEEVSNEAIRLHEESETVLKTEKLKRELVSVTKKEMCDKQKVIEEYFSRSNISHQRVIIENNPYNICKRISVIKPKLSFGVIGDFLRETIPKMNNLQDLLSQKEEIMKAVLLRLSTMPSTTKTSIHLQKLKIE